MTLARWYGDSVAVSVLIVMVSRLTVPMVTTITSKSSTVVRWFGDGGVGDNEQATSRNSTVSLWLGDVVNDSVAVSMAAASRLSP